MSGHELAAEECKIGRAALGWRPDDLAAAAAVAPGDVVAFEAGGSVAVPVRERLRAALDEAGIAFALTPEGRAVMRVRTLDGIIEAPVTLRSPPRS